MISITGSNFSFQVNNNNKLTIKVSSQDGFKFANFFQEAKRQASSENSKPSISNDTPSQEASANTSRPRTGNDVRLPPNGEIQFIETDLSRELAEPNTSRPRTGNDVRLPPNGEIQTIETDLSRKLEKLEAQGVDVGEIIRSGGTLPEPKPDPQVPTEPTLTEPQVAFDIALPIPLDADGNPPIAKPINPPTSKPVNPSGVPIELDIQFPPLQNDVKTVILSKPNVTPIVLGVEQPASQKPEAQAETTRRNIFNFTVS